MPFFESFRWEIINDLTELAVECGFFRIARQNPATLATSHDTVRGSVCARLVDGLRPNY